MSVYADTSALYALIISDDADHDRAARAFTDLRVRDATLISTSYTLVEDDDFRDQGFDLVP